MSNIKPSIFKNAQAGSKISGKAIKSVTNDSSADSISKLSSDVGNARDAFAYALRPNSKSNFDSNILSTLTAGNDVKGVSETTSGSWSGAVGVSGLVDGQSSVTAASANNSRVNPDGSINPFVDNNFSDFKNFDSKEFQDHFGFNGVNGVQDQIKDHSGDDGVPEALIHSFEKEGGAFNETMGKLGLEQTDIKNMFERASEIDGYLYKEGSGKFGEAANKLAEKFVEAGLGDQFKNFGDSVHDQAEVLSHAMKNNMSTEGIKNFGDVYKAYLKNRDNTVNSGLVTREAYNHYKQTGDLKPGVDHGMMQLNDTEFKGLVNDLNTNMARDIADATDFGADKVMNELKELGATALNNYDGTLFAAMGMSSLMAKEDSDGKTGFDKLVADSRARDGAGSDKRYEAATNLFTMNDSVSRNTDGTAFSRSEGAVLGLDAVSTLHGGGLRDNPFSPNTLAFGHQGSADASTAARIDKQLTAAREAGIDHKIINHMISGHGSERQQDGGSGGILINSEKSSGDSGMFTTKDVEYMAPIIAKNIANGGTFNVTADACETDELAQHYAKRVSEEAEKLGKNIKTTFRGSEEYGLVSSHQLGERTNGDTRSVVAEDGTQYMHRIRGDHNGNNTRTGEFFSKGKDAFMKKAEETKATKLAQLDSSPEADPSGSTDLASALASKDSGSSTDDISSSTNPTEAASTSNKSNESLASNSVNSDAANELDKILNDKPEQKKPENQSDTQAVA